MRTLKINLKPTKAEKALLTDMAHCSKNLYNTALYHLRQVYAETQKHIPYASLDKIIRETKPRQYYKLNSVAAQNVLRELDHAYQSFFSLNKLYKSGGLQNRPRPPKYKKESGLNVISLNERSFVIRDGSIEISVSKYHRNRHDIAKLYFPYAGPIDPAQVSTIDIMPLGFGRFELHLKYEELPEAEQVNGNAFMSIDLGLNNLCSAITTDGDAFLVSGKELKSINAQWNKRIAELSQKHSEASGYEKMKINEIKKNVTRRRNRNVTDILHKISKNIIRYAISKGISDIVVGHNVEWKKEINIGKVNNQKFVNIPHSKLIEYLKYKGKRHGITVTTREESYTSKCDSLALEAVQKHEKYMGRRTKRGMFKSSVGKCINADINGALNIFRKHINKSKGESEIISTIASNGRVFRPRKTAWGLYPRSPKLYTTVSAHMLGTSVPSI